MLLLARLARLMFHSGRIKGLYHAFKRTIPHHTLSSFCTLIVLLVATHAHRALCRRWALNWSHHATFPQNPWTTKCRSQGGRTEQAVLLSSPPCRAGHHPSPTSAALTALPLQPCPGLGCSRGQQGLLEQSTCLPACSWPPGVSLCESQ